MVVPHITCERVPGSLPHYFLSSCGERAWEWGYGRSGMHTCTHACTHAHTCAYTHTHMDRDTHTHILTHTDVHRHALHTHTHTHRRVAEVWQWLVGGLWSLPLETDSSSPRQRFRWGYLFTTSSCTQTASRNTSSTRTTRVWYSRLVLSWVTLPFSFCVVEPLPQTCTVDSRYSGHPWDRVKWLE